MCIEQDLGVRIILAVPIGDEIGGSNLLEEKGMLEQLGFCAMQIGDQSRINFEHNVPQDISANIFQKGHSWMARVASHSAKESHHNRHHCGGERKKKKKDSVLSFLFLFNHPFFFFLCSDVQ